MKNIALSTFILTILVSLLPLFLSPFMMYLTTEIFIMAIFAMSLGLIMGYGGLDSLGHSAFFGIGAYTVAVLSKQINSVYLLLLTAILFLLW